VKLLLDEMYPAEVAVALREQHGHDATSVRERPDLRGRSDEDVFAAAQTDGRAVVTENVRDFRPIVREWEAEGRLHHGVVFTTNRRFPRARPRTVGRLVSALADLLARSADFDEPSNLEIWL
jgi:hypothetical protein